uniref:CARD domain-containing protein n=1 Tax=Plectus sambesii TaxID=2011161 RepID=A0A914X6N7_9BILA
MKKERRELNEKCRTQLYDAIVRNKCSEELLKELEMQEKNGNDGLSQYNINLIKSYPKEEDKVRQLLHFSTTSGDSVFDSFIQAITHTNKPELIEILYSELPPDQQTGNEKSTPAASASAPASSPLEHSFGQAASSFQDANIKRDSGYYSWCVSAH